MNRPMYLLWVGALIGAVLAIAVSSAIALSMFATDCPWPILWGAWGKLLVLTIPTCSAAMATIMLFKYAVPRKTDGAPSPSPAKKAGVDVEREWEEGSLILAEEIVLAAHKQAEYYYLEDGNPTRRLFEQNGMRQALWSSARELLRAANIVDDNNTWAEETWATIEVTLDKIHPDYDRIWVRPLRSRDMLSVSVSEQTVGNKYTAITTPPY